MTAQREFTNFFDRLSVSRRILVDYNGGNLTSDGGLIGIREFSDVMGFIKIIEKFFHTYSSGCRIHSDPDILLQMLFQIMAGYKGDNCANALKKDPVFTAILNKSELGSQSTLCRTIQRMDESTVDQLEEITRACRKQVYSIEKPNKIVLDVDSTLLDVHGKQDGAEYNYHYDDKGYHILVCFDAWTGDLLRAMLRKGSVYCSNGVVKFLEPVLDEMKANYPDIPLTLRGDSGFAVPELYTQCEENGLNYAIRLKLNKALMKNSEFIAEKIRAQRKDNCFQRSVEYGEFQYQAESWDKSRRVIVKAEVPYGQFDLSYTFIVTNMDLTPEEIVEFYCKRGNMENFIKELKNDFDFCSMCSHSMITNANRLQIHALAYNIFTWFKRLVLPPSMRKQTANTIRLHLLKVAVRVVHSGRYIKCHLCSSFPFKNAFMETMDNIRKLNPLPVT